jgi:hypothetical protein
MGVSIMAFKAYLKGKVLITETDMTEPILSPTGKTYGIATSHGNQETDIRINGKAVRVGLNAFYANPDFKK